MTEIKIFVDFWNEPIGKLIKEALRWAVLGAVSIFVTRLLELIPNSGIDPDVTLWLTIILKFIDGALHKTGVAQKGLTRF